MELKFNKEQEEMFNEVSKKILTLKRIIENKLNEVDMVRKEKDNMIRKLAKDFNLSWTETVSLLKEQYKELPESNSIIQKYKSKLDNINTNIEAGIAKNDYYEKQKYNLVDELAENLNITFEQAYDRLIEHEGVKKI